MSMVYRMFETHDQVTTFTDLTTGTILILYLAHAPGNVRIIDKGKIEY